MTTDIFHQLYEYHFAENRRLWDTCIVPLSQEQFVQPLDYSLGSARNQIVHLISVDNAWFSDLSGQEHDEEPASDDRQAIRAYGDAVEQKMRAYLATLHDESLFERPFPPGEDAALMIWQVLMQVINHGTDHRAQMLRQLHDLGADTRSQDFIFYVYGHP